MSQAQIASMRRSLKGWLDLRARMDAVASGKDLRSLLPGPGMKVVPKDVATLREERRVDEQRLANHLYNLLSEVLDPQTLPSPNLANDPDAAARLAEIAITGKLPSEAQAPGAQGFVWMWPLLLVGGAVLLLSNIVKSFADVAKEKERIRCIQAGACTDTGFWMKAAAITVMGYFAWEKFGPKEKFGRRGRSRR